MAGRVYLFNGASDKVVRVFTSPNAEDGGQFGAAVAQAGDANEDGIPDLLVGAPSESPIGHDGAGRAYLLSGASGETIRAFISPNAEERGHFGAVVTRAGDVNRDGAPDLLFGAERESVDEKDAAGRAYLFSGSTGRMIQDFSSPGAEEYGLFGTAVERIGGTTGNGTLDLLIGAVWENTEGKEGTGRVHRFGIEHPSIDEKASRLLAKRHPDLVKPRGEFETTKDYQKRQRRAEAKQKEILKEIRRKRLKKIQASLTRDTLSIQKVGSYNTDREVFPITIRDTTYEVKVPLEEARSFDENWRDAVGIGYKQLTKDYVGSGLRKYRRFNLKIVHPVAGSRYPIGPQEEMDRRTVATQKQIDPDRLPETSASVDFTEPSGNDRLDGGETATVRVTVRNDGQGPARRVQAQIRLTDRPHLSYPTSIPFGTVPADTSASESIQIQADRTVQSDTVNLTVRFDEANGFSPSPVRLQFQTQTFIPPELTVADVGIDDASGNGVIEPGEVVDVTARIRNQSRGAAEDVSAEVHFGNNVFATPDTRQFFDLGDLGPGEHRDIRFTRVTNQQAEAVPVTLDLTEKYGKYGKTGVELPLIFDRPTDRITEVQVEGQETDVAVQTGEALSVDVETNIPSTPVDRPNAVAVVIGNKTYRNEDIPDVKYAARDAQTVKKYLTRTLGVGEENVIYVENATAAALTRIFGTADDPEGQLHNWVKPGESEVFVYYSGHGAPSPESGQAYLVPYDANPNYLSQNGYPARQLYGNLAKVPAKSVTLMLEGCFSGVSEGGAVLQRASPVELSVENPVMALDDGLAFTAGAADQIASWYPEKKHGLFTYFFLKGLRGPADWNGDRAITSAEMGQYLTEKVPYRARRMYNREQTPEVVGQAKNRVLVRYTEVDPSN